MFGYLLACTALRISYRTSVHAHVDDIWSFTEDYNHLLTRLPLS